MALKDLFAAHANDSQQKSETHQIVVAGMHCNACEQLVSQALEERGAKNVSANHETGVVEYEGELEAALIEQAVTSAGFSLA